MDTVFQFLVVLTTPSLRSSSIKRESCRMESNTRSGVAVKQPTTFNERIEVCGQFCQKLKPAIPVVVDEIRDTVGNAYSGMPARMYVIDGHGKVAFKSGRGPYGFRVGEMEQALIMALLESEKGKKP